MGKRIIVALDGISEKDALWLADKLKGEVWGFKVNDLLVECGIGIVSKLKRYGAVFADAKLHDIPNTVANGVRRLRDAGADLITIHASGGAAMISAASEASKDSKILTVTVLTSLGEEDSKSIFGRTPKEAVLSFARLAKENNAAGIVCSAKELELFSSSSEFDELLKVIPGIRPSWHIGTDDQQRIMTPAKAVKGGASLLVIGRPITKHEDPAKAVRMINEELVGV